MRYVFCCVLVLLSLSGTGFADEIAFKRELSRHITENSWVIPGRLQSKAVQVGVVFTIDRDGKLLDAAVDQSSGSPADDADLLSSLRRMRAFPRVPDELNVPYEVKTTFNLGMQRQLGYVELQWPPTGQTSGQEIAYRSDIQHHLRVSPRVLPDDINIRRETRSIIAFSLDRDGHLIDVRVTKSFGMKAVDDKTIAWLKSIEPFPKMPSELSSPIKLTAELVFLPKGIWNDEEARRRVNGVCRGC
ncbi:MULTISPECIES: TonB family protein [unclassified Bradyrhizobium]|uniref:TonB family protein n=1 Tax=unclassified Bradyrhizobium TaxID=2631580 RepID=UPI0028ED6BA4|nr:MULTISPECIES: TonB family protein [unclassified Bradyrhizobium]